MMVFLRTALLVGVGVGCLTLSTRAQQSQQSPASSSSAYEPKSADAARGTQQADRALAKQLADAKTDADKEKARAQLAEHIGTQFDARQKEYLKEVEELERQVNRLKSLVQKRQENRKEIVDERVRQLVREAQGLGWSGLPPGAVLPASNTGTPKP